MASRRVDLLALAGFLAVAFLALDCGGGGGGGAPAPGPNPPVISSFTATPPIITAGQSSTLAWTVAGATSLSLDQGIGTVSGSSRTVAPAATTTYTLTAGNSGGNATAAATVTVQPPPQPPVISSFTATPAIIAPGQSSTLAWTVAGATSLSLDQGIGTVTGNSRTVAPVATSTYTLTATNSTGSVTAAATVTVQPSGITLSVIPAAATLRPGEQQQFTAAVGGTSQTAVQWTATGGTIGAAGLYTAPAAAGSYKVRATLIADPSKWAEAAVAVTTAALPPRLELADFQYLGAFRTPFGQYGSGRIAFNPVGQGGAGSLFLDGGEPNSFRLGEIGIPQLTLVSTFAGLDSLRTAPVLQSPGDLYARIPLKGSTWPAGPVNSWDDGNQAVFGGLLWSSGKLYFNAYTYYDAMGQETATTGRIENPQNLAGTTVSGMFRLQGAAHTSGWLAPVPAEWQARLGGTHLAGHDNTPPIVSRCSAGPSLFAFNLANLSGAAQGASIATTARMDFSLQHSIWGSDMANVSGTNKLWNLMTWAGHGFIVPGTRTYAVLGAGGGCNPNPANPWQGTPEPAFEPPIAGTIVYKRADSMAYTWGGTMIWDAQDRHYVYAFFDLDEMLSASSPWAPRPYANGVFPGPFARHGAYTVPGQMRDTIAGAAWDEAGQRLFLSLPAVDNAGDPLYAGNPVIAVYRLAVTGGATGASR